MREEVIAAVRSLADLDHQKTRWGVNEEGVTYYDDLTLVVNVLYDDTAVLPEPSRAVGVVIYDQETTALRAVGELLSPLIEDIGNAPDNVYIADARWPAVVDSARMALATMKASDSR